MSDPEPSIRHPRRRSCANASLRAEIGRVSRMTIEERVKAELTMRECFDWLQPEIGKPSRDALEGENVRIRTGSKLRIMTIPQLANLALLAALTLAVTAAAQERSQPKTAAEMLQVQWSRGQAEGNGPVKLSNFPLRVEDISHINPMGMMASGHVVPTDHLYLVAKESPDKNKLYDVIAVADGRVVMIQWRPNPKGGQPDPTVFDRAVDLKVVVEHAATCWSYVDHLIELAPDLQKRIGDQIKPGQPVQVRIPVKAGEVLGKVRGGFTFDFALIDTTVTNEGFVKPDHFLQRDPHRPHVVDPFLYVDEPLRSKLLALNPRKANPAGGRIDYDREGQLVGNWYREGSGGYAGIKGRWDYWVGHLAFAYHHVDPTQVIISIGDVEKRARQFQVHGNTPDPAKVGKEDGIVKFSLIEPRIDNRTGKQLADAPERFYGVLLVQVLDHGKLRLEVFPNKGAEEVKGFSDAAQIYER